VVLACVVLLALLGAGSTRPALADDGGGGSNSIGAGSAAASGDQLAQLTETVQELAQSVQQVVQTVQQVTNFAGALFTQASGSLFGGAGIPSIAAGGAGGSSSLPTGAWLAQLQQWVTAALFQTGNSVWSEFGSEWGQAPDYTYSTTQISAELQQVAAEYPGQVGQWVAQLAQRLANAPAPQVRTPQWDAAQVIQTNPTFATRADAVQQAQVASTATQADAQATAQQSQQVALQTTSDTTAQQAAAAAQQVAQQAAAAVESAPSTRAAVEVMAAALTQQQAEALASQAAIASKLDALVTQQAQVATALADAVGGLGTVSGLLSQQLTQTLEDQSQGAVTSQDTIAGAATGIAAELDFIGNGGDQGSFNNFFTTSVSGP